MDVCAFNLKSGGLVFGERAKSIFVDEGVIGFGSRRVSEFRVRNISVVHRSLVVRATGKKKNHDNPFSSENDDPSIPEADSLEGVANPVHDDQSKSEDLAQKSPYSLLDWRDFRANLVAHAHELLDSTVSPEQAVSHKTPPLGSKWAHSMPFPEPGCVLVATEKLDGVRDFERTVILLLRTGTSDPREGPFGVIINRPFVKKIKQIKQMNPSNTAFNTTFANCPLHFGGPLEMSMFLIKTADNSLIPGFKQVVPGICFGARNSLEEAAELVKREVLKAEDVRFFVGYAGWKLDQLMEEIESDYWVVASCSSYLIAGGGSVDSTSGLWHEILQLMGGQYSELSRKPKRESS